MYKRQGLLRAVRLRHSLPFVFIGNVGEEGEGDLRGICLLYTSSSVLLVRRLGAGWAEQKRERKKDCRAGQESLFRGKRLTVQRITVHRALTLVLDSRSREYA